MGELERKNNGFIFMFWMLVDYTQYTHLISKKESWYVFKQNQCFERKKVLQEQMATSFLNW